MDESAPASGLLHNQKHARDPQETGGEQMRQLKPDRCQKYDICDAQSKLRENQRRHRDAESLNDRAEFIGEY